MKTIGLISLQSINNAGDEILANTTEYLINNRNVSVRNIEFRPVNCFKSKYSLRYGAYWALTRIRSLFHNENTVYKITNVLYKLRLQKYFRDSLRGVDAVVLAIGMLKYTTQEHSYILDIIIAEANRSNIPVCMSAMSIAAICENDWRFCQLKEAVNRSSVKVITTRDGEKGLDRLRKDYVTRKDIITDYVGDPALWIPECYGIKRQKSTLIGIGLVQEKIYIRYGKTITPEQLLKMYKELILKLEEAGENWVMFSNGIGADYDLGLKLIEQLNLSSEKLLPRPKNAIELVNTVSQFGVVLGARLHACITAFSLDIPVVGLMWDEKLKFFADSMKIRDFFIEDEDLNGEKVYERIVKAKEYEIDKKNREDYRIKTKNVICKFLDDNL